MRNFRVYGDAPYNIVAVHGGPGALGDMGYVSDKLSTQFGVLEALQTKHTVKELVDELIETITLHCNFPVALIGHSWGAWLAYMVAVERPDLASKLVLLGSGPFLPEYAKEIESTRLGRLSRDEQVKLEILIREYNSDTSDNKGRLMEQIGTIIERADAYLLQKTDDDNYKIDVDGDAFGNIWGEAAKLRESGILLDMATKLECEVTVIHGDYDPHPVSGVIEPLSMKIEGIRSIILSKCGHYPWKETYAHDDFFEALSEVLGELRL